MFERRYGPLGGSRPGIYNDIRVRFSLFDVTKWTNVCVQTAVRQIFSEAGLDFTVDYRHRIKRSLERCLKCQNSAPEFLLLINIACSHTQRFPQGWITAEIAKRISTSRRRNGDKSNLKNLKAEAKTMDSASAIGSVYERHETDVDRDGDASQMAKTTNLIKMPLIISE